VQKFFRVYILPGLIFQSVVIGGGYATGRELIEFFYSSGPIGGILGLLVSGITFGLSLALAFEFARLHKSHDYRLFCKALLGRFWIIYELAFLTLLILVLSVITSASEEIINSALGIESELSILALAFLIGILTFLGSTAIKQVLASWSILLYLTYIAVFVITYQDAEIVLAEVYTNAQIGDNWIVAGLMYSGYNLAVLPVVLFAVKSHNSIRHSFFSGAIAGFLAVIPAILFFVTMMSQYPHIGSSDIPSLLVIESISLPFVSIVFQVVVLGTFIETGTALLHAVNERIESSLQEINKPLPQKLRPIISITCLFLAVIFGSYMGIVDLIAKGYGFLTIIFISVLILPLISIGVYRIVQIHLRSRCKNNAL
tara:strand:+ start:200 stop:1312 length:1113 start_codon:yes stop_codon:yes gene_type:complete